MNSSNICKIIKKNGLYVFRKLYKKNEVNLYKKYLENILKTRIKKKEYVGSYDNKVLWSYFKEEPKLMNLVYIKKIDNILKKLLDKNYVFQCGSAQNRSYDYTDKKIKNKLGSKWHTDSRYLNGKRLEKGFSYLVIVALDEFTENNATSYIPMSHLSTKIPKRNFSKKELKKLNQKKLIMDAGDVCIMDSGTWHKGGKTTNLNRWSVFNVYTGWFVKPYYDYSTMKKFKLNKIQKKILHFNSTPPKINDIRNTLIEIKS